MNIEDIREHYETRKAELAEYGLEAGEADDELEMIGELLETLADSSQHKFVAWLTQHCTEQTGNYRFLEHLDFYSALYEKRRSKSPSSP